MKKSNIRFAIVVAVLLVIFNLLVFVLPIEHNGVFWLSYGFTLDAFVIAAVACIIAFRSNGIITSKFFGYPVAKVGVVYLLSQLALCFIFMALSRYIAIWFGVLIYAIGLGLAVIGLVATDTVRDHIELLDIRLKDSVSVIRTCQAKVIQMASMCNNPTSSKMVEAFSAELRYSDPVSSPNLTEIEADLSAAIDELQQAVVDGDDESIKQLCQKAFALLKERNRLCKLYKK